MGEQGAGALPAGAIWKRLSSPIGATAGTAVVAVALAGLALLLAGPVAAGGPTAYIFEYLFNRNEPAAAWVAIGVVVAAAILARGAAFPERMLVSRLAADPRAFIFAATAVLAAAALLVYRAHPLSMDEYAPLFQARVFARGQLAGQVPPQLVPRLVPPFRWFIEADPSGAMLSSYWPGFALLLTPFVWLGCPWLLNPLIGGAALWLVWRLAARLWPDTSAAGWALLFTAASPAFSVNAISFYSMGAHLAASLGFALLVLEGRLVLAGVVGSLALALHNPFPHLLFALPWLAWIASRPDRLRSLARLALGYAPGLLVLVGGWLACRARFTHPAETSGGVLAGIALVRQLAFTVPTPELLLVRMLNVAELASWGAPLLLPLAALGAFRCKGNVPARLLTASAVLTLFAYAFVRFDQGHGWGYRYFHSAWGVLPLLAAGCLEGFAAGASLRRLALAAGVGSLVLCTPLRFWQVRTFMDAHLAQVPAAPGARSVTFLDVHRGSYTIDLIQNDPFLESSRWVLISFGEDRDAAFMRAYFPGARRISAGPSGSAWQVE